MAAELTVTHAPEDILFAKYCEQALTDQKSFSPNTTPNLDQLKALLDTYVQDGSGFVILEKHLIEDPGIGASIALSQPGADIFDPVLMFRVNSTSISEEAIEAAMSNPEVSNNEVLVALENGTPPYPPSLAQTQVVIALTDSLAVGSIIGNNSAIPLAGNFSQQQVVDTGHNDFSRVTFQWENQSASTKSTVFEPGMINAHIPLEDVVKNRERVPLVDFVRMRKRIQQLTG